ncbi:hypothetical protein CHELA40_13603 [Chelatococcus asaccharovorans]|nr:hypothetical protein CHELA40_13603 [Chelatococcus asaccharovorans]CAH1676883.1 hypothetical protein CHELA17_62019 [Chelatococcus asaccharovorans]
MHLYGIGISYYSQSTQDQLRFLQRVSHARMSAVTGETVARSHCSDSARHASITLRVIAVQE